MNYSHYGEKITYQSLGHDFKGDLEKAGIEYIELPLISDCVVTYIYQGNRKYAYIVPGNAPDEYIEHIYIVDSIPLDMNWSNIALDVARQKNGEEPMQLPSRARVLYDKACKSAVEFLRQNAKTDQNLKDLLLNQPSQKEINYALASLGTSLEDLRKMDHHDLHEID